MTPKQQHFVDEYLVDLNATQAAMRAGYGAKSAASAGSRLLRHPAIALAIETAKKARSDRTQLTQDRVLKALGQIAFANLSDYLTWGEEGMVLKNSTQLDCDQQAAIIEVSMTSTASSRRVKIRQGDKLKALELLGKHLGMFIGETHGKKIPENELEGLGDDELEREIARLEKAASAGLEGKTTSG